MPPANDAYEHQKDNKPDFRRSFYEREPNRARPEGRLYSPLYTYAEIPSITVSDLKERLAHNRYHMHMEKLDGYLRAASMALLEKIRKDVYEESKEQERSVESEEKEEISNSSESVGLRIPTINLFQTSDEEGKCWAALIVPANTASTTRQASRRAR